MPVIRKNFYVMRHAQSTDNLAGLISGGASDPDLTEEGKAQAAAAALIYRFLRVKPTRMISSSLKRAMHTASLLDDLAEIFQDEGLNERNLGELDGLISEEEQKLRKILPGEECSTRHRLRVLESVNRHLKEAEAPIFICHGGTIRRLIEALEVKEKITVENARIYRFWHDGSAWHLEEMNDAS